MSNALPTKPGCCVTTCDEVIIQNVPGPAGADGVDGANGADGVDAFTTTTAQFVQPAVNATVNVAVIDSSMFAILEPVFVAGGGGSYTVSATPDGTHVTIKNLGYAGNAAPAALVAAGVMITPSGIKGVDGSAGSTALDTIIDTDFPAASAKGQLLVDNGANTPNSKATKLASGTNGQLLAADSTQATGLGYKSVVPNAATDNAIARYDGAAGTPVPLQTSKLIVTDNGAAQASGSGGNARGTDAIDLQVSRAAVTQVASGNDSVVTGGDSNTASGTFSAVGGGTGNLASGLVSAIAGGNQNVASGTTATVAGGSGNVASATTSTVGGGNNNEATAANATVAGGDGNSANAPDSAICGGSGNDAGGNQSFIGGGSQNSVTAGTSGASVVGGSNNVAFATLSCVLTGSSALANHYGEVTQNSGVFTNLGDAQVSKVTFLGTTTDATPTEIFLDGGSIQYVLANDSTYAFRMLIVARRTDVNDESAAYQLLGCIDRNANAASTALVGSVSKTVIAEDMAGWDVNATADVGTGSLVLTVTGENAKTIQWVAACEITKVTG